MKAALGSIWAHHVFSQLSNLCGSQFAYCTKEGPIHVSVASVCIALASATHNYCGHVLVLHCLNTVPPVVDNEHSSSTTG